MINYKENYNKWLEDNFFDEETREELSNLIDEKEIEDRFYRDLEFGTGGLRGVMGAGTNRMNKYTIGKATKGLGTYLLDLGVIGQQEGIEYILEAAKYCKEVLNRNDICYIQQPLEMDSIQLKESLIL